MLVLALDEAVRALGHPGRRAMRRLARDDERSASELADAAGRSGACTDLLTDAVLSTEWSPVVLTYGWDRTDVGIPPGSTVVEIATARVRAIGLQGQVVCLCCRSRAGRRVVVATRGPSVGGIRTLWLTAEEASCRTEMT